MTAIQDAAPPIVSTRPRIRVSPILTLGIIGAVVGFAGSWIPSYWGDEAASILSATRSWPSLAAMLDTVDGVHGVYYALLHVWIDLFGTSELSTRLPSALAIGAMVAGTVALAKLFTNTRTAVIAGIVAMMLPRVTAIATEARSYALGAAAAVWITVLLVHLLRRTAGRRAWLGYAVAVAASMYLFLYLGLLLLVHGVFIALIHRRALARWAVWAAAAVLLAAPIVVVGYLQREQIAFLAHRDYATAENVLVAQWFGYPVVAVIAWMLVLVAVAAAIRGRGRSQAQVSLTLLALVWVSVPTALLLVVNATVSPAYNVRYLSFCAPGAALLVALGIDAVASRVSASRRTVIAVALTAVVVAACIPAYAGERTPWGKDRGSDLRAVADYVQSNAQGGAVIFDQTTKPSRDPRLALDLYPRSFAGLDDVALETAFEERAGLWDSTYANDRLASRISGNRDIWAVELVQGSAVPDDITFLETLGYEVQSSQLLHRTTVYHLVRR